MRARGWWSGVALALAVVVSPAGAQPAKARPNASGDPPPKVVDLKAVRDKLLVLQDAEGGTYVVLEPRASEWRLFYGPGRTLHEQVRAGRSSNGDAWSLSAWAPRVAQMRPGTVERLADGTYRKMCGDDAAIGLTELTGSKADAVLAKVTLKTPLLVRRAHLLARDDAGIYYYVDKLAHMHGGKGFRVFVGRRGAMKQVPLVDVASDAGGDVFATKTGSLRLGTTTMGDGTAPKAFWVRGERRIELINLDLDVNSPLIFSDLGIYRQLGTLCDTL